MNRFRLLFAVLCALSMTPVFAANNAGWFEITPSGAKQIEPQSYGVSKVQEAQGDRMYIVRPGDSLSSISKSVTGSAGHAQAIAAYNGIVDMQALQADALLFVPASLVPDRAPLTSTPTYDIREFQSSTSDSTLLAPSAKGREKVRQGNSREAISGQPTTDQTTVNQTRRKIIARPVDATNVVTQNVDMFAGEVDVFGKVAVKRVAVGNGEVVRAEVLSSGELLVIAQKPGSTSLRLWHADKTQSDYNIRVSENDPETRIRMERMVRMKVRMVEFKKSALGRLGINWSDSAAGPTLATAGDFVTNSLYRPSAEGFSQGLPNAVKPFSTYFGVASNITSRINFLSSSGDAVTLAEPVLSCANGGTANFLAGGEVPYPSVGANGQTVVQFKEYGIKLNISPTIDTAGNVRTLVDTEISQIDQAVTVNGAPGLLTRRAQTQVNVRSGETIVISGLLSAENSKDIDRLPGIGRFPILGALFSSNRSGYKYRNCRQSGIIR